MSATNPTPLLLLAVLFALLGSKPVALLGQAQADPADEFYHDTRARMEKERRDGEWQKLKDDTDKLVQAANELKEMLEKSNKDTLSISIVKKTEQAQKILKEIKRRAKSGI